MRESTFRHKACVSKVRHKDRQTAKDAARKAEKDKHNTRSGRTYKVYECPLCNGWHLATRKSDTG